MSQKANYSTTVTWKEKHLGEIQMGNGPVMDFSAPPDAQGMKGVLTPEDAFVGAVNTCIMMMFLWACERFKINLLSYTCEAEGTKLIELDRTEQFVEVKLSPTIKAKAGNEATEAVLRKIQKALTAAQKYSLVANSIKPEVIMEPAIEIVG